MVSRRVFFSFPDRGELTPLPYLPSHLPQVTGRGCPFCSWNTKHQYGFQGVLSIGCSDRILPKRGKCIFLDINTISLGFPDGSVVKNPPVTAGDTGNTGSIPGSGRSPGGGNGNPLQCSCLENSMDRAAWWATVHGDAKSRTRLSDFTFFFSF